MTFEGEGWRLDDAAEAADRATLTVTRSRPGSVRQRSAPTGLSLDELRGGHVTPGVGGRFADAERRADEALSLAWRSIPVRRLPTMQLATLRVTQGHREGLEAVAETASTRRAVPRDADIRDAACMLRVGAGAKRTKRDNISSVSLSMTSEGFFDQNWLMSIGHLASACAFLRDVGRARVLYRMLSPYASRAMVTPSACFYQGPIALHLAVLGVRLGLADAAGHFEHALELDRRMRARPWLARTQYEYARALLACDGVGNRERAQALLDDALATASQLNMPLLIERSEALQAETRPKPPSAGRGAIAADESPRARSRRSSTARAGGSVF
jgi:hypothetical protein